MNGIPWIMQSSGYYNVIFVQVYLLLIDKLTQLSQIHVILQERIGIVIL